MRMLAIVTALFLLVFTVGQARAEIRPGRDFPPLRSFSFEVMAGQIQSIEGQVVETKRAYTDGVSSDSFSPYLENYNLRELGFDSSYNGVGFRLEKKWTYLTLGYEFIYSAMSGSGTAEREPFAIGADVSYNGKSYDYMLIEQGASYDADLTVYNMNLSLDITPFHIASTDRWLSFSPWIHLGLVGAAIDYNINAGPAKGITTYEYTPYPYVINGSGSGLNGGLIPEIGLGGELRMGIYETEHRMANLVIQAEFFMLSLDTTLASFGVSARNDKDISLDYAGVEVNTYLEIPISENNDLLVGLRYRSMEADADVEAQDKAVEQQDVLKEKYDKKISLGFDTLFATIGMTF